MQLTPEERELVQRVVKDLKSNAVAVALRQEIQGIVEKFTGQAITDGLLSQIAAAVRTKAEEYAAGTRVTVTYEDNIGHVVITIESKEGR